MPEQKAPPESAYKNKPLVSKPEQPVATKSPDAVVHGLPEYQQTPEGAIAVELPSSIPTVQVDTGLPQSEVNVTPQDSGTLDAPAILPKDVNPRIVPAPGESESVRVVPTSETHLAGQPQIELPDKVEDKG